MAQYHGIVLPNDHVVRIPLAEPMVKAGRTEKATAIVSDTNRATVTVEDDAVVIDPRNDGELTVQLYARNGHPLGDLLRVMIVDPTDSYFDLAHAEFKTKEVPVEELPIPPVENEYPGRNFTTREEPDGWVVADARGVRVPGATYATQAEAEAARNADGR